MKWVYMQLRKVIWFVLFVFFFLICVQGILNGEYDIVRAFVKFLCPSCVGLE